MKKILFLAATAGDDRGQGGHHHDQSVADLGSSGHPGSPQRQHADRHHECAMKTALLLGLVAVLAGCGGGHNDQPSPASTPAMDSAMTAVHDSGSTPDSTVSDTTP
jgi:hypothetical protein